jgi:DNA-binding winged helix-turn-helix (wHTH) protein/TolB-like protein
VIEAVGPVYRFGPFHYDTRQRLLFRGADIVPVTPKALDTLHALIERRDRIVDKPELMGVVWGDTAVEETGLARNISVLRKVLGDDYIETIPKRGYRFVGDVVRDEPVVHRTPWIPVALAATVLTVFVYWQFYVPSKYLPFAAATNVAVIPFETAEHQQFSRNLSELLVAELTNSKGIRVLSPGTVRRYQSVGISPAFMARLIGIEILIEGTVQAAGDRLRVTARIADVHTGKLIGAYTYEYPAAESHHAEVDTPRRLAAEVRVRLNR